MSTTTAIAETNPIRLLINNTNYRKRFEEVLKDRAPQFLSSLSSLSSVGRLRECKPESVMAAAYTAACLDLPINKDLGYAWIIPYKIKDIYVAQFQLGYKGICILAIRTGLYKSIRATAIPEGVFKRWDPFLGKLELDWDAQKSDQIVGHAAQFALLNGYEQHEYWTIGQVERHAQRYSQAYKQKKTDSPWFTNPEQMGNKTVLKSLLSHYGILSIEMQKAVIHDQGASIDIDSEVVHPDLPEDGEGEDSPPPAKKITKLQAAKEKMAAEKKATEPAPGEPLDTLEEELTLLKEEIQKELLATGGDEEHMRMLCCVASNYKSKWFELSQLKDQREVAWLRHTLAQIVKANESSTELKPEQQRQPGEDDGF